MTRGLQIVQWTIAAQPGHPVFLDVLDRIVGKWLEEESNKSKQSWDDETVLNWTGPGPWSDAILRYVRYGSIFDLCTSLSVVVFGLFPVLLDSSVYVLSATSSLDTVLTPKHS